MYACRRWNSNGEVREKTVLSFNLNSIIFHLAPFINLSLILRSETKRISILPTPPPREFNNKSLDRILYD